MLTRLLSALRTVIAVPVFFLFTVILAIYVTIVATVRRGHPHIDQVIRLWSRVFLMIGPVRYEVEGREKVDPNAQYVFVANHLSNFDIPLLFVAIPNRIRYLAKKELYKIPFVAQAMKAVGIVKVDRQAGRVSHESINRAIAEDKALGYSLIIFPEGTRSRDGNMKPFKKGAFRIAIDNGLPVVPVTIHGTWEVWKPESPIFYPGHAEVIIHDPIPTDGMTHDDIEPLRDRVHDLIESTYEEIRRREAEAAAAKRPQS